MKNINHNPLRLFWQIVKAERQEIRSIYIFAIFQGLVGLSLPLGIQSIINFLQAGELSTSWYMLVLFVLGGILLSGLLQMKQLQVTETIEQRLFANVSYHFAEKLPRMSMQGLTGKYIPELLNRFFEVGTVQKGLSKVLIDFSSAIIQVVFGMLLLSLYDISFAILGIVLVVVLYAVFRFTGPTGLSTSIEESKYKFEVAHWLQEVGRTLKTFKLSGHSPLPLERTDNLTSKYLNARNKHFSVLMTQFKALIAFKMLVAAGLVILGSVLVISKQINIGQFVAAEIVVLLLISSVEKIILNMNVVYDVLTSLEKIEEVTEIHTERRSGSDLPEEAKSGGFSISVKNLTFSFEGANKPIIRDFSMEVKSGETVCIKGKNGVGKTTLLKLLSGFYENYTGSIAFNGIPLGNLKLESLRKVIGENFTEQEIFRGTIAENISCGLPEISLSEVINAARIAGLGEFVENLPQGFNTMLEPEGQRLPGGVRRRMILARCFACNPKLLLIEDTLIAQSKEERDLFFDVLFTQCHNITTIIVTNEDEVANRCNRIITIENSNQPEL